MDLGVTVGQQIDSNTSSYIGKAAQLVAPQVLFNDHAGDEQRHRTRASLDIADPTRGGLHGTDNRRAQSVAHASTSPRLIDSQSRRYGTIARRHCQNL